MKRQYEQRPVNTKVIRKNFRAALEREMNSLMSEGWRPEGGVSSTMNTQARPLLGIDTHEYSQTMVKYETVEIWVKETNDDFDAFKIEQASKYVSEEMGRLEYGISKNTKDANELKEQIIKLQEKLKDKKKSFTVNRKLAKLQKLKERYIELSKTINKSKTLYVQHQNEVVENDKKMVSYYKNNPAVTKDILLKSK